MQRCAPLDQWAVTIGGEVLKKTQLDPREQNTIVQAAKSCTFHQAPTGTPQGDAMGWRCATAVQWPPSWCVGSGRQGKFLSTSRGESGGRAGCFKKGAAWTPPHGGREEYDSAPRLDPAGTRKQARKNPDCQIQQGWNFSENFAVKVQEKKTPRKTVSTISTTSPILAPFSKKKST